MEKCQKCFKGAIKACDGFGTFITFRINDDIEYKSIIGGCSTILFVIITVIYTTYCCSSFFSRKNVDFIFTNKIVETDPQINLTSSHFNLAFGVQYSEDAMSAIENTSQYFTYKMNIVEWIGDDDLVAYPFSFKQCEPSDFYNVVDEAFENNDIGQYICPDFFNNSNFTLEGLYTDYYFKFIELEIRLTEYALNNLNEVEAVMKENPLEMAIFFLDSAIDYENRKDAIPSFINYSYKVIDFDFIKTTEIFISSLEFQNDDNLLFDNSKLTIDAMFDHSLDSFRYVPERFDDQETLIGKFIIKASPKIIQVNRQYQKFPSFLADLTSLLEEILVLMLLFVNFVERKAVDHKLINKMLKFRGSKYYDIDYLINVFNKDKISNKVTEMIQKQNLKIERKNNVRTTRRSIMLLLNNRKTNEQITDASGYKKTPDDVKSNDLLRNENNIIYSENNSVNNSSEDSPAPHKNSHQHLDFNYEMDDELNQNIQMQSNSLSSKKNSIYYKNDDFANEKKQFSVKTIQGSDEISSTTSPPIVEKTKSSKLEYSNMGIMSIIWASVCFWTSKRQKRRHRLISKAESKIHYYLDIYTYIKKMQEIDLLKYCLFDEDQSTLFKFLSKPPIQLGTGPLGLYKEFEQSQVNYKKLDKPEIDALYHSYKTIRDKEEITFEDLKLLRLVTAEIKFLNN